MIQTSFYDSLRALHLRAEKVLLDAQKYLAHIPKPGDAPDKKSETLGEHLSLVLDHAKKICELHGLDIVVERLIKNVVEQLGFRDVELAAEWVRDLFVNTIVFHDFGKVNEYFQTDRMQNQDNRFKGDFPELFSPRHGHSELGGYIYLVYHLEKIGGLKMDDNEKVQLAALAFLYSNSILLHHSPRLKQPRERVGRTQFILKSVQWEKYLRLYRDFPLPDITPFCFDNFKGIMDQIERGKAGFALFALLRLNFSLLTAADYMATWHYGYKTNLATAEHWGVFSAEKQAALCAAAHTTKVFNAHACRYAESGAYTLQHPTAPAQENLNLLRTEMAVEMLIQLRQHTDKRLFYLEAPTGGGKTNLSMLAVAELMRADPTINKIFYVFPFTTLITQTQKSIQETLNLTTDDIALLHSRVGFQVLSEAENGVGEGEEADLDGLYGPKRRNFLQNLFVLYPCTLLTHIRFFDILKSNQKDDIYLMHRLANSVVVIDELQSYPPKQWDKILYLLDQYGRFFNIRFILMSATLPRLDQIEAVQRAAAGRLPAFIDLLPNPKRYFLNPNFRERVVFRFDLLEKSNAIITLPELTQVVLTKSNSRVCQPESDGRVFTIVEFIFKKSATAFFQEILNASPFFDEIFVLSGSILESRRREIIAFLKRNQTTKGLKVLLITTQVVEAGVDIDMDLGFKNISLIDSDEQLAGRVNRNVRKKHCEVYLFHLNEPNTLYGEDFRFKAMREMTPIERREILEQKKFEVLYQQVFARIEQQNRRTLIENFTDNYLPLFHVLDFPNAHDQFKLIDQPTLSVFVPLPLPLTTTNEMGEAAPFFSNTELQFLAHAGIWNPEITEVDGAAIWRFYRQMSTNQGQRTDYVAGKTDQKIMQGILSKFTFSMFDSPKNRTALKSYCDPSDCFEYYFVLTRYRDLYDLESGLDESKLHNADNFF